MEIQVVILLILFNVCHWLADYSHLSTPWMLGAKKLGKPLFPILVHALVHATLMSIVMTAFCINWEIVAQLFTFQLASHFIIDVWKGRMNGWFPSLQSPVNKWHWIIFGFDQLLHQIVKITMVYKIFS